MSKRLKQFLKLDIDPELKEEMGEELDHVKTLKSISKVLNSNGGKALVGAILADGKESLTTILEGYKTMPEIELRATIADLAAILRFYSTIRDAENDANDAESMLDARLDDLLE